MSSPDRRKRERRSAPSLQSQLKWNIASSGRTLAGRLCVNPRFFEALRVPAELDEITRTARETCKCRDPSSEQATEQFELTPEQRIIKHSRGLC
jgi:hypothetical protein